ncbi:galactose mutarotase-like domain-containing protein [Mucidula mucida]|nr:galactose mutarotase-like domain-containing protein [Mucidula mucida]
MTDTQFKPVLLALPSLTPSLALETHDIVVGPEAPEAHVTQKYTNTIIGRYANRVPVATHKVERHGFTGEVTPQGNQSERVSLHGGPVGYDSLPWEQLTTPPTLFSKAELSHFHDSHAIFRLVSPDGEQGYPGTLTMEVLVALLPPKTTSSTTSDMGSLIYVYRAKVDKDVTPINLTQHWGFNLDASLKEHQGADVKGHVLKMKADRIASLDEDGLHHNSYISVAEAPVHDHTKGKKIGDLYPYDARAGGYDDYYVFSERQVVIPKRVPVKSLEDESFDLVGKIIASKVTNPLVELSSETSGLAVAFDSNQSGAMFYTNTGARLEKGARKKIHGGSGITDHGDGYAPGTAAFLEFHDVLAAFLKPENKDGDDTLLTKDELYNNYVRCDVTFVAPRK